VTQRGRAFLTLPRIQLIIMIKFIAAIPQYIPRKVVSRDNNWANHTCTFFANLLIFISLDQGDH